MPEEQSCEARRQQQLDQWTEYLRNRAAIQQPYDLLAFSVGSAVVGGLWFIVFWAIGWVLAGFARDERPV